MTNVDVALSLMSSEGSNDREVMADSCVGVVDVTNLATTTLLILLLGEEKEATFERSIANIIITA